MRHSKSRLSRFIGTGAVANRTYRGGVNAVWLQTTPTQGESVYCCVVKGTKAMLRARLMARVTSL